MKTNQQRKQRKEIADALRVFRVEQEEHGETVFDDLERLICSAQQAADELDMHTARGMYFETGKLGLGKLKQHRRYKKIHLLRIMLLCASLKTSWRLAEVFRDVIDVLMPPHIKIMLQSLTNGDHMIPDKATVSRYRSLLDGALMLFMRASNRQLAEGRGAVRYMLADSSMQHGTEFEAVLTLTVEKQHLVLGAHTVDELIDLRRFFTRMLIYIYIYTHI